MPIIGMTDRGLAFPEIGRIRKGAPKPESGNKPGKDLEYFRFDLDARIQEEVEPILLEAFGPDPKAIDILLPFNTVDENFDAWREAYLGGGMVHKCDGQRVWYELDVANGAPRVMNGEPHITHDPKLPILTYRTQKGEEAELYCKPHGRLKVIIPQLRRGAFLTAITNSIYDCINLSQQLRAIEELNGKLSGIPLILSRRPVQISAPYGSGVTKRTRVTKWLLAVEVNPKWMEAKLVEIERQQYAMLTGSQQLLTAPELEDEPGDEPELHEDYAEVVDAPKPKPVQEPKEPDAVTRFWARVYDMEWSQEQGVEVLKAHDMDAGKALQYLVENYEPPADAAESLDDDAPF